MNREPLCRERVVTSIRAGATQNAGHRILLYLAQGGIPLDIDGNKSIVCHSLHLHLRTLTSDLNLEHRMCSIKALLPARDDILCVPLDRFQYLYAEKFERIGNIDIADNKVYGTMQSNKSVALMIRLPSAL